MTVFDRLRQLEANATPAPWASKDRGYLIEIDNGVDLVAEIDASYDVKFDRQGCERKFDRQVCERDADFIVVARNLWGPLVDVAEAAASGETCALCGYHRDDGHMDDCPLAALERAATESAVMSEGRCPGFPNCRCPNKQWSSLDDPHGTFGAPGMMGG